jgi:hypothetical protein
MVQTPEEIAARTTLDAERSAYWQRVFSQQRTQIETSKLVATVVLALAGTLVGTAMQVQPRRPLDVVACVVIALGLAGLLLLLVIDHMDEPDIDRLSSSAEPDGQKLHDIMIAQRQCCTSNEKTAAVIRKIMLISTFFSLASGCVAVMSLLGK